MYKAEEWNDPRGTRHDSSSYVEVTIANEKRSFPSTKRRRVSNIVKNVTRVQLNEKIYYEDQMERSLVPIEYGLRKEAEVPSIWRRRTEERTLVTYGLSYDASRLVESHRVNHPPTVFEIARMTTRTFLRKNRDSVNDNERFVETVSCKNYQNFDKDTNNWPDDETCQPYSINTLHLQNSYKAPQRLEGFASRNSSLKVRSRFFEKPLQRSKETIFRSRNNNFPTTLREASTVKVHDVDDDKTARYRSRRRDIRLYLKKMAFAETAKQYCSNSSLHGLRYIGDSSLSMLEKLFWLVAFIAAVLSATYFILHLYQKWTNTPIIISMSPEPVAFTEFPFPSVTVCNMNNVRRSEATRINKGDSKLDKLLLEDQCNFRNNSEMEDQEIGSANWTNVLRFMINVTQPCTEMLSLCQWHGNVTDCDKIFNPTMTDEGICCNFNAVHRKHLFYNPREWSDLNITFPYASIDWNPETGYDKSTTPDSIPWRPYGAGKYFGLTLVLDSELKEYYCSSTASVGFKMFLHNPVETPKIADFAFALSPGKETRIVIKPKISSASWSILRVPKKKRKCFFTSERRLRYYRTYTQKNCLLECEANFTQKICHCVQYYMPKSSNTPICGKKDDLCATTARRAMEYKLYDEDIAVNQLNITETPSCNCWPGCFEMNYENVMSTSTLAQSFEVDDLYLKKDQEYFAKNMAVVHLYFVDSQFPNYVKSELFGFIEFLSSTGGLLGLFMGFSFLSVAEIVYFITIRVWCRLHGHHGSHGQAVHVLPAHNNQKQEKYEQLVKMQIFQVACQTKHTTFYSKRQPIILSTIALGVLDSNLKKLISDARELKKIIFSDISHSSIGYTQIILNLASFVFMVEGKSVGWSKWRFTAIFICYCYLVYDSQSASRQEFNNCDIFGCGHNNPLTYGTTSCHTGIVSSTDTKLETIAVKCFRSFPRRLSPKLDKIDLPVLYFVQRPASSQLRNTDRSSSIVRPEHFLSIFGITEQHNTVTSIDNDH